MDGHYTHLLTAALGALMLMIGFALILRSNFFTRPGWNQLLIMALTSVGTSICGAGLLMAYMEGR